MALASNICHDQTTSFNHSGSQINHNGIVTFQSILVIKSYWIASFNGSVLQVNRNGVLSFQTQFFELRPQSFPLNDFIPLIAPFWYDVDIGNIFYRQTSNASLLQRARDELQELFPSSGNFTPTTLFIATWDRVAESGGESQVCIHAHDVTAPTHCDTKRRDSILIGHTMVLVVKFHYLCVVTAGVNGTIH